MKTVLLIIVIAVSLAGFGCSSDNDHTADSASEEYYTCPMHPSVRSDRPGACPVCGMALVKKSAMDEANDEELAYLRGVSLSPTQRVLANVSVLPATTTRVLKDIAATGIVEVSEPRQSTVTARFRGRIEKLFVSFVGQVVSKGEPLFALYSPDLVSAQQDYLLAFKGTQLSTSGQFAGNSASLLRSARERLRTHYGMTEQQIKEIESSGYARSTVTFHAPVSGTVLQKSVVEGEYVDEGSVLYQLADLSYVWVFLDIYEQDISFLHEGLDVALSSDSYPGRSFPGRITFIDPVVNPETRSIRVRSELRNPGNLLKPGMFVRGRIDALLTPLLAVPTSAILSTGMRDVVWVEVTNNTFEPREITKGVSTGTMTQVLKGLREGESVVVTGGYLIDSENTLQSPGAAAHGQHLPASHSSEQSGNELLLTIKGTYSPDILRTRQGIPLRLRIYRDEQSACTEEIVFSNFGVRANLKAFDTTMVTFTPDRAGTFTFSCGIDMIHGTLIVE